MTTVTNLSTDQYWDMLKDLSVENKIDLISRLSNSIVIAMPISRRKNTLNKCFGSWKVNESEYPTDELLNDIDDVCKDKTDFVEDIMNL